MAPNRDTQFFLNFSKTNNNNNNNNKSDPQHQPQKPPHFSMETLKRTVSDISFELTCVQETLANNNSNSNNKNNSDSNKTSKNQVLLPPISEIEDAKCECCGMSEECTPQYVKKIRDKFCGRMVCGLCSEAVKEEMEKNGGNRDEALHAHVSACSGFNRVGRAFPVLGQAQAMREILRKNRGKSLSPRDQKKPAGGIARSSSCIPAITKEMTATNNKMVK